MKIVRADTSDIPELYRLHLLAFESEAEMIGSRQVPALLETESENALDFCNWVTLKAVDDSGRIAGAVRYRKSGDVTEIGRLMVHPESRRQGLAQRLLSEVNRLCLGETLELYTCTKSWSNIRLYEKMGYSAFKECTEESGLSFVYMRKTVV